MSTTTDPAKAAQSLIDISEGGRPHRWELRWFTITGHPISVRYHDKDKAQGVIDAGFPATLHPVGDTP
jgi:hypothetical protein